MGDVISLAKSLGYRGNKDFQEALYQCAHELFGLDRAEYAKRWRPRIDTDKGTLRGFMQPTAEALFEQWKQTRDAAWLYSHPEYKWDSIGVSVCQTHATTGSGIKLLKDRDVKPRLAFDWGAGPGFSTLMFARNFPKAEVHYNELNPDLIRVFDWFKLEAGITNAVHVTDACGLYDVVQAYEIAEHIPHASRPMVGDPITATMEVLAEANPVAHFLHSSCWTAENNYFTLGHFLRSEVDGVIVGNTRVGLSFRNAMKKRGWEVQGTGWNSRPFLFKRG